MFSLTFWRTRPRQIFVFIIANYLYHKVTRNTPFPSRLRLFPNNKFLWQQVIYIRMIIIMIIIIMVTSTSLLVFSSKNDYYQSYLFAELELKYWTLLDFSRKIFPNILVQSRDVIFLKDLHNIFLKLQKMRNFWEMCL